MNTLKTKNDKEANIVYAVVIAVIAIAIPVYSLWGETWDEFELSPFAVIIPLLYVVIVIGFMLMALNIKVKNITSPEADEKIINKYSAIRKKILPYILLVFSGYITWSVFSLWQVLK